METRLIWFDGELIPWNKANLHVTTHTLHYGSGSFEGIRCYQTDRGPAIFRLADHINRLLKSFSCFKSSFLWSKEAVEQAVIDTVKANNLTDCYLRPIIFFGSESLSLSPRKLSAHCAIISLALDHYANKEAISVGISSIKRIHPESVPIHRKINGFYVNSIFAFHEALGRGFDDALLFDHEGNIAECSVANVFFVIDGVLKTPPSTSIFPGITRSSILTIAHALGIQTQEEPLSLNTLDRATEAFLCGTASGVMPIRTIENRQFDVPGIVTQKIKSTYHASCKGKDKRFESWLTFVNPLNMKDAI